jgi:nitroreductase
MKDMKLFDALRTLRSVREFTDEPVTDEQVRTILEMAVFAPSAGNRQPWHFVVIRDAGVRRAIRDHYLASFRRYKDGVLKQAAEGHEAAKAQVARWERHGAPDKFAETLDRIPVLILVCLDRARLGLPNDGAADYPFAAPSVYASVYPAVENLLLAAHGLGLGAVLTTLHLPAEREIKALLRIPAHVQSVALVPIGHPARKHGPPQRTPAGERTHWDRW